MSVFRSFFGRIHDPLIYFQDLVTFSNKTEKPLSRTLPEKQNFKLGLTLVPGSHSFLGTQNHAREGHNWKSYINEDMPKMATQKGCTWEGHPWESNTWVGHDWEASLGKQFTGGRTHTGRSSLDKLQTFYKKTDDRV